MENHVAIFSEVMLNEVEGGKAAMLDEEEATMQNH